MLVAHQMARPVKIEGNPDHPASLGAASAVMQASILELYDPRRAQTIVGSGQIDAWQGFVTTLFERAEQLRRRGGEGLRLLTGTVTSPSLAAQIAALQQQFPAMRWHQWEPLHRDAELAAGERAFGRPLDSLFDVDAAEIIFAVESDLISAVPGWLANARHFAARRRAGRDRRQNEPRLCDRKHADPDRRQGRSSPGDAPGRDFSGAALPRRDGRCGSAGLEAGTWERRRLARRGRATT